MYYQLRLKETEYANFYINKNKLYYTEIWKKDVGYHSSFYHRRKGKPACSCTNGNQDWIVYGKLHRAYDKPARIDVIGKFWFKKGKFHREKDSPAVVMYSGTKEWYQDGLKHRENDLPAVVNDLINYREWHLKGLLHRDNHKPALISKMQEQFWFKGQRYLKIGNQTFHTEQNRNLIKECDFEFLELHSINDEPAIVYENGTKEWYCLGDLHRVEKPAVEYSNGDCEYWRVGLRHRDNGPAIIYGNKQYYFKWGRING
ncbi:MAG: hypothetical protein WCG45_04100 [bacterium]